MRFGGDGKLAIYSTFEGKVFMIFHAQFYHNVLACIMVRIVNVVCLVFSSSHAFCKQHIGFTTRGNDLIQQEKRKTEAENSFPSSLGSLGGKRNASQILSPHILLLNDCFLYLTCGCIVVQLIYGGFE